MNASTQRSDLPPPIVSDPALPDGHGGEATFGPGFDAVEWSESRAESDSAGAGGRAVLGTALSLLAVAWTGYSAWSAGRALAVEPLTSPAFAQWVAIAAGPLALLGLVWIMFGRTRRREAERFTRSVIAMRTEARSLEELLQVLSRRIEDSHASLGSMANQLMHLGDEATARLGVVTREFDAGSLTLARHGEALDRAAESARNDIAVLLDDLPRAEASAQAMGAHLRGAGDNATAQAAAMDAQLAAITARALEADTEIGDVTQRLVTHLAQIESAGTAAVVRVGEASDATAAAADEALERAALALSEIRTGVDAQAAAVAALVEHASAGLGRAGAEAADALGSKLGDATRALDGLSAQVAEQDRAAQRLIAGIDGGLADLDSRFTALASDGDARAATLTTALARIRAEVEALAERSAASDGSIGGLAERTTELRRLIDGLTSEIGEAEAGSGRLLAAAQLARPEIEWMHEAVTAANAQVTQCGDGLIAQENRLASLLGSLDEGVGGAETRLEALASAIAAAQAEAGRLSGETAPALVAAMVQVREAAAHAAERAREAIAAVIPEGVEKLSAATRAALEQAVRASVIDQLAQVDAVATRAVESARIASDRLTGQMLSIGQSATALEAHIDRVGAEQREADSEAFARRVAVLIDSMHSASIDVGKILSNEVDDKAWAAYLKGDRGAFTRRAVRLLDGTEARAIAAHYEADREFQSSVNRYVHDFEAMLRRVMAERDGGVMAVTMLSSDMGKLYAALGQAIDRRRGGDRRMFDRADG